MFRQQQPAGPHITGRYADDFITAIAGHLCYASGAYAGSRTNLCANGADAGVLDGLNGAPASVLYCNDGAVALGKLQRHRAKAGIEVGNDHNGTTFYLRLIEVVERLLFERELFDVLLFHVSVLI
jgi:hypothetical protein